MSLRKKETEQILESIKKKRKKQEYFQNVEGEQKDKATRASDLIVG